MNSNVEQGILAWLLDELEAAWVEHGTGENKITVTAATISGKSVQLLALTSNARVVELWPAIIVKCEDAKIDVADAANQLWLGTVEIAVLTPRNVDAYTEAFHRALAAQIRTLLKDAAAVTNIATALAGHGIAACHNWFFAGSPDAHTDGRWITILRLDPFAWSVTL